LTFHSVQCAVKNSFEASCSWLVPMCAVLSFFPLLSRLSALNLPSSRHSPRQGHALCADCAIRGCKSAFENQDPSTTCFAENDCEAVYTADEQRKFLTEAQLAQVERIRREKDMAGLANEGLLTCPFVEFSTWRRCNRCADAFRWIASVPTPLCTKTPPSSRPSTASIQCVVPCLSAFFSC
jgi:hypothetical protein